MKRQLQKSQHSVWEKHRLGELCSKHGGVIQTGPFGSQLHQHDYVDDGTPVLMPKDIVDYQINLNTVARISDENVQRLKKHKLNEGDLLLPRRGEISKNVLITQYEAGFICGTGCIKITLPSVIFPAYFKYYLRTGYIIDWLESNAVGATMLNLSGGILYKLPVILPPIKIQKKIAAILSAYDDLIENNLTRIKLLEEMAQITYEEWFVRLKFPGHETTPLDSATGLPEGWRFGKTLDLFELQRGFDLPIQEREDGDIPIIASTGTTGFHSSYKVKAPGVVTGRSGTVGQVMFVDSDFWPLNTTLWVKKFKSCGPIFVKHFLENFNLESLCGGSAVPSLDRKAVHVQKVAIPAAELTKKFEIYASSLYDTTKVLRSQNELLKEARDILLPRLMTGMIDVDTFIRMMENGCLVRMNSHLQGHFIAVMNDGYD